jgi:hypothetical protein
MGWFKKGQGNAEALWKGASAEIRWPKADMDGFMKTRGVPRGFTHNWAYHGRCRETKTGPRTWKGRLTATKYTKAGGKGPPPGYGVRWGFRGTQTARKIGKGRYQTDLRYTKTLMKVR